jgi:GNAT superfamily N-acetyltransferase
MQVERLTGAQIEPQLDALARLRIAVFREFPYLYDGSLDYERDYLRGFAASPRSTLVIARDGASVVGAATATPLLEHAEADACATALRKLDIDPAKVYYFGESVLLSAYRGRGIGNAFFAQREAGAERYGFPITAFCAVVREVHPAGYLPHDAFWRRRGYRPHPEAIAYFSWRDIGASRETEKPMLFWTKELTA